MTIVCWNWMSWEIVHSLVISLTGHELRKIMRMLLDAPSHLYKRVCPSVGPSVRPSVTPSLSRLLGASYAEYSALFFWRSIWKKKKNGKGFQLAKKFSAGVLQDIIHRRPLFGWSSDRLMIFLYLVGWSLDRSVSWSYDCWIVWFYGRIVKDLKSLCSKPQRRRRS